MFKFFFSKSLSLHEEDFLEISALNVAHFFFKYTENICTHKPSSKSGTCFIFIKKCTQSFENFKKLTYNALIFLVEHEKKNKSWLQYYWKVILFTKKKKKILMESWLPQEIWWEQDVKNCFYENLRWIRFIYFLSIFTHKIWFVENNSYNIKYFL